MIAKIIQEKEKLQIYNYNVASNMYIYEKQIIIKSQTPR